MIARLASLVESHGFQYSILGVIVLAAVLVGIETSPSIMAAKAPRIMSAAGISPSVRERRQSRMTSVIDGVSADLTGMRHRCQHPVAMFTTSHPAAE